MTRSDVFRAGDVLNGYRLLEDFRVVGAGLSEWSFAERGGRIFFIKRFLSPTYPEADQSAPTRPVTRATPAASEDASDRSVGSRASRVCADRSGPSSSRAVSTDSSAWPTSPSNDTSASIAGKIASTA